MNSLNSVLLEGNLTKNPVLHETPKGTPVCNFGLAVNRYYRQDEDTVQEVSFFDIETWSRLAQYCGSQFVKGSAVRVVGRLKQERWEDQEGNSRSRIKVVGEHMEPIDKKKYNGRKQAEDGDQEEAVIQEPDSQSELIDTEETEKVQEELVV